MTDEQIEGLVTRILQSLRPPVLVMVTAADGYRAAIRQRLAGCGYPLRLRAGGGSRRRHRVARGGRDYPVIDPAGSPAVSAVAGGTATVSRLSASLGSAERHPAQSGLRCAHEALLAGIPVLALRYHCDPHKRAQPAARRAGRQRLRRTSADHAGPSGSLRRLPRHHE